MKGTKKKIPAYFSQLSLRDKIKDKVKYSKSIAELVDVIIFHYSKLLIMSDTTKGSSKIITLSIESTPLQSLVLSDTAKHKQQNAANCNCRHSGSHEN